MEAPPVMRRPSLTEVTRPVMVEPTGMTMRLFFMTGGIRRALKMVPGCVVEVDND